MPHYIIGAKVSSCMTKEQDFVGVEYILWYKIFERQNKIAKPGGYFFRLKNECCHP